MTPWDSPPHCPSSPRTFGAPPGGTDLPLPPHTMGREARLGGTVSPGEPPVGLHPQITAVHMSPGEVTATCAHDAPGFTDSHRVLSSESHQGLCRHTAWRSWGTPTWLLRLGGVSRPSVLHAAGIIPAAPIGLGWGRQEGAKCAGRPGAGHLACARVGVGRA